MILSSVENRNFLSLELDQFFHAGQKKLVADLSLEKAILKDVAEGNF